MSVAFRIEGRIVREPGANDNGKMFTIPRQTKPTTSNPRNTLSKTSKGSEEKERTAAMLERGPSFKFLTHASVSVPDIVSPIERTEKSHPR